jgi:hypothetical protein
MCRRMVVCFGLVFGVGMVAPPPPTDDPVCRESDEEHDREGREVDGWAGVRGDDTGEALARTHATSRRRVASQPAAAAAAA